MNKNLFYIYLSIFLVYVGYGLTLPLLPFFVERMSSIVMNQETVSLHVGMITGVFALMQVLFAPLWGKLSDTIGRKPLFSIGLIGTALSIFIFGISSNLYWLYSSRIIGGIFSAAVIPVASSYVSDLSPIENRGKVLAWIGGASAIGATVGPAASSFLSNINLPVYSVSNFSFDEFSIPFTSISILLGFNLFLIKQLPEISNVDSSGFIVSIPQNEKISIVSIVKSIRFLLILSFVSQYSLMLFEATFSLHAKYLINYGTLELGIIYSFCGGIMGIAQSFFIGHLIDKKGEKVLMPFGFLLTAIGIISLMVFENLFLIILSVTILSIGISSITPSLSSLISKRFPQNTGSALGVQNSVDNLGKGIGAILGGILFALNIHLPFLSAGLLLLIIAAGLFGKYHYSEPESDSY
ncbi:MAG: MFS transporter [Ignavibacteriales bacterium]|nr:MAG: MFS transporter [Ignavibacteriales bacterium]